MCIAKITEQETDLWSVDAYPCTAGRPIMGASRRSENVAMDAAIELLEGKGCGTVKKEIVRKPPPKANIFAPKPSP